jgi:ABC-type uncharacterized transport system substrate-binding protein
MFRIRYAGGHMLEDLEARPRRRGHRMMQFMSALVLALCAIIPASAETAGRHPPDMPVVGWLGFRTDTIARDGLWLGLHELGYVDGKNIAFEYRFPEGSDASFAGPAEELVRQKVNILAPAGFPATDAVRRATSAIPVVFVVADPIGAKFAESLAHPGGNMTGSPSRNNLAANGWSCSETPCRRYPGLPFSGTPRTAAALRRGTRCRG